MREMCETCQAWQFFMCNRVQRLLGDIQNNAPAIDDTNELRAKILQSNTGGIEDKCAFHGMLIKVRDMIDRGQTAKQMRNIATNIETIIIHSSSPEDMMDRLNGLDKNHETRELLLRTDMGEH